MLKKEIEKALIDLEVSSEHVDSTAVPELAAKPIIDVDVLMGPMLELISTWVLSIARNFNATCNSEIISGLMKRLVFLKMKNSLKSIILNSD